MEVVENTAYLDSFMSACNALVKPDDATFIATRTAIPAHKKSPI